MFLERFRLDGKAALVTGGSRGLGLEAALALKEAGARVAVLARRARYLEEAKEALGEDALYLEGTCGMRPGWRRWWRPWRKPWGP
jgi:NAD(P)-dependent dehydrogenase (short-subunit alcohol dehydrogenase family)